MRVVALDFDGVLNSSEYFNKIAGPDGIWDCGSEAEALDPAAIARLNRLLSESGAVVVISSSWRHGRTVERLEALLRVRGFRGTVIDKTPDYVEPVGYSGERGDEIRAWLDAHPDVASYVVLDDNSDMTSVRHRFIQTDMETGLTDADVDRAIAMLREVEAA